MFVTPSGFFTRSFAGMRKYYRRVAVSHCAEEFGGAEDNNPSITLVIPAKAGIRRRSPAISARCSYGSAATDSRFRGNDECL